MSYFLISNSRYYNRVKDSNGQDVAQVVSLGRITSAYVRPLSSFKQTVKTDPVIFESAWVGKNRRYLNIGLALMMGATDEARAHRLTVIGDTIMTRPDQRRTYLLRLYHDQNGIPEYYSQRTFFSLPLQGLTVDSVQLIVNTYDGTIVRTLAVR